jgi:ligand-binding sensor domain-containing protein/serine phosphatase RsbU (regulator of sigma subunit)
MIYGQRVRFQDYSLTDGLCHPFVYNIIQDKNGFIWIGTGEGLCRYDGISFVSSQVFDSLPKDVVNVSFIDNFGKLWFGYNNGEVWSFDGNYFNSYTLGEDINTSITGFAQSIEKGVFIATQNKGIYHFSEEGTPVIFGQGFENYTISTLHIDGENLFIGTQQGLFCLNLSTPEKEPVEITELSYIKIQRIINTPEPFTYWIGTEDEGLYRLYYGNDTSEIEKVGQEYNLGYENIQDIIYDADSSLLLCSFNTGLVRLEFDGAEEQGITSVRYFDKKNGLTTNFVKCAFVDRESNLWVGTYGEGIALKSNQSFDYYSFEEYGLSKSVMSIAVNDSLMWLGGERGILQINTRTDKKILLSNNGLPDDKITSLAYNNGILWVGTSENGIYKKTINETGFTQFFRGENSISNAINHIVVDVENVYAATKNGIFVININSLKQYHYSTLNGLPHNDIEQVFLDAENRLLFATRTNGIYEITVKGEVQEYFTVGKHEIDFNSIVQDKKGNLWVGTYGQGVFLLQRDSIMNFTSKNGLKSDYCYSMVTDDSLYVWVGHRLGLSRINIKTTNTAVFDIDNGITGDCNTNAAVKGMNNKLFFGTTDGLIAYDIKSGYKDKLAPLTNILKVIISDKNYDFHTPIVLPYSAYKLRIEYVGLYYADPEAVRYQYMLEGYDLDWSDVTDSRTAIYPRIEDGEYTFLLKAIGSDGTVSHVPAQFKLKIKLPVWKTWWFITLLGIIVVLVMIIIVKYRERKQKQIQEYLEQRLDERTREVVSQKEEIEVKNRDITDSINYAQRIQTSILPPIKRLQQYFDGSFIFYQPRDIVSGDFYWFDKIKENKFVIVCADSTGHGVPGAFMSMIGTTLIKDVCMRSDVNSPSKIIHELDIELRNTLNQNVDAEQSNDGMDIIVCEIDIQTNYLRYASAMRPMIVYHGGEQIYIKGSRSSVGGQYDKDEKIFKDEGMQLDKGDLIYMFSDGYPDQFGGSVGKKFKMVRLKNLLRDINQKAMEEQYEYVKSTFNLWKEDFDQVDDVLFMGIKI